jgi:hypothetical protein
MTDKESKWWEDITIENYDWRDADPLSNAFVDIFLLALIRAHPMQNLKQKDELERLRYAKEALFGIKPKDDRKTLKDIPFLVEMARGYISDRRGAKYLRDKNEIIWGDFEEKSCRGVKTIARNVYDNFIQEGRSFNSIATEESVINRMARKFRKEQDDLILQVATHGNVEDGYMIEWINQARDFFGPFSIPVADADDPVRDLKCLF